MADNNLEITYIPYGLDEISQLDLMTNLANGVEGYLGSKRWARKDKYRNAWLAAYLDIIGRGLTGASNDSGVWTVNHNGEAIPLDTKSEIEKEMYQDAAYYIQLQMAKMTPRKKEEEKKKKDLTPFDFLGSFGKQLLNLYGGNRDIFTNPEQGWNTLDARGADGLRGTTERRKVMAEQLRLYKLELEGKDYNFEGTSFKDKLDALDKIQAAIDALGTEKESDDLPAFSALGLNYRGFFSNGGNEATIHINQETGNPYTYNEWNQLQLQLAEAKTKLEAEKLKAQQANYWKGFKSPDFSKLNGRPLKTEESNIDYLTLLFSKGNWNGNEASQIVTAFKLAEKNGQLVPLSKEELSKLNPNIWGNRSKYLRKINGINSPLYYDTLNKLFKYFYNLTSPQTSFLDILNLNNPEAIAKNKLSLLAKQMNSPIQGSLNLSDLSNFGFDEATGNELWAVINDIGAFVDPEAITGTAMALNAARLRDKNREGWSWERVLDWGTSALGGLPVIGDAASVVKAGSNLVKLANRSARVGSFIGMAFSAVNMPEAWDSIKKIYDKGITSMTPQDILNITYGLMGLFAGIKTINAVNARQKPQTATEHSIEIDGKKVKLPDQATADKVSAEYKSAKNNTEASLKVVKMQEVREAAKKAGIEVTDASKVTSGSGFLRGNLVSRKLGIGKSPVKSELVNTGEMTGGSTSGYYMPSWRRSFLNLEQKEIKNPLRKTFDWFLGRTPEVKSVETPKTNSTETSQLGTAELKQLENKPTTLREQQYNKATINRYKEHLKGNFSNKTILEGTLKIGDKDMNISSTTNKKNGKVTYDIHFGNKHFYNLTQDKAKLRIFDLVKENRKLVDKNSGNITKKSIAEIGKILLDLKKKGWLKQGGQINPSLDTIIEDFIKNNNI